MKKIIVTTFILLFFCLFFVPQISLAQSYNFTENSGLDSAAQTAGYETADSRSVEDYISLVISIILSLLGVIFLALMMYGGIIWMTAAGNDEKVKKAKDLIIQALIGLVIVLSAYAISYFVLNQLINL